MNYYEHHIGDYQKKTAHLSVTEHGSYLLMLQTYYATEKPLPTGKILYRLVRAESRAERDAVDSVVDQFWNETPAGLTNDRADEVIAEYHAFIAKQSANGKASANKRWGNLNGNGGHSGGYNGPIDLVVTKVQPPTPTPTPIKEGEGLNGHTHPVKTKRKASRVPPEFTPDASVALAELPDLDFDREVQKFRDWEFRTPRSDWPAVWRNWIETARETGKYAKRAEAKIAWR